MLGSENIVMKAAVGLNRGGDPELDAERREMANAAALIARRAPPEGVRACYRSRLSTSPRMNPLSVMS